MVDIGKQITHWRLSADEDWEVARGLVAGGKVRHGLFFAHLALEKILKAHVCKATDELSPPIHNLIRLVERAGLPLSQQQRELLAEANAFNIEGRYPGTEMSLPSAEEVAAYILRTGELLEWLNDRL
jgi:HEPN domain-containing protein